MDCPTANGDANALNEETDVKLNLKRTRDGTLEDGQKNTKAFKLSVPPGHVTEVFPVPNVIVGLVIGKGGCEAKRIFDDTGCRIQVDQVSPPGTQYKNCILIGLPNQIIAGKQAVAEIVGHANKGMPLTIEIIVPGSKAGLIIGSGGGTIKAIKEQSGAELKMIQDNIQSSDGDKPLRITGQPDAVQRAQNMVIDILRKSDKDPPQQGNPRRREPKQRSSEGQRNRPPAISGDDSSFPYGAGAPNNGLEFPIPKFAVGMVIGYKGETVGKLQEQHGVSIQFNDTPLHIPNKICVIRGRPESCNIAADHVRSLIDQAHKKDALKGTAAPPPGNLPVAFLPLPANSVGYIIGKGGDTIRMINNQTGAFVELDKSAQAPPNHKVFKIMGHPGQIEHACRIMRDKANVPHPTPPGPPPPPGYVAPPQSSPAFPPMAPPTQFAGPPPGMAPRHSLEYPPGPPPGHSGPPPSVGGLNFNRPHNQPPPSLHQMPHSHVPVFHPGPTMPHMPMPSVMNSSMAPPTQYSQPPPGFSAPPISAPVAPSRPVIQKPPEDKMVGEYALQWSKYYTDLAMKAEDEARKSDGKQPNYSTAWTDYYKQLAAKAEDEHRKYMASKIVSPVAPPSQNQPVNADTDYKMAWVDYFMQQAKKADEEARRAKIEGKSPQFAEQWAMYYRKQADQAMAGTGTMMKDPPNQQPQQQVLISQHSAIATMSDIAPTSVPPVMQMAAPVKDYTNEWKEYYKKIGYNV